MINVLGDALAAGIMAHICRKDFAQDPGTEVGAVFPHLHPNPTPRSLKGQTGHGTSLQQTTGREAFNLCPLGFGLGRGTPVLTRPTLTPGTPPPTVLPCV